MEREEDGGRREAPREMPREAPEGPASRLLAGLAEAVPGLGWLLAAAGRAPAFRERLARADAEVERRLRRSGRRPAVRVVYGYRIHPLVDDEQR